MTDWDAWEQGYAEGLENAILTLSDCVATGSTAVEAVVLFAKWYLELDPTNTQAMNLIERLEE